MREVTQIVTMQPVRLPVTRVVCDYCGRACSIGAALEMDDQAVAYNDDLRLSADLCLTCLALVAEFIDHGPGPGTQRSYRDPMGG